MRLGTIVRVWKSIEGYEGLYEISNLGEVKSLYYRNTFKSKIIKPKINKEGYLFVGLCKDGKVKQVFIHRLVTLNFIPNNDIEKVEVNHIDEDKTNNNVNNLEWVTPKENSNHGTHNERISKALSKKVLCVETGIIYSSANEIKEKLGLNNSSISKCCNGKQKTSGGYHWKFIG